MPNTVSMSGYLDESLEDWLGRRDGVVLVSQLIFVDKMILEGWYKWDKSRLYNVIVDDKNLLINAPH